MEYEVNDEGIVCLGSFTKCQQVFLEELASSGAASKLNEGAYSVQHATLATFSTEERELLDLPECYPYGLKLSAIGITTDRDFHYTIQFTKTEGQTFVNVKRTGAIITIGRDLTYSLTGPQYALLTRITVANTATKPSAKREEIYQRNFLALAEIKKLAEECDATCDLYLQGSNVIVPEGVDLAPRYLANGDLEIEPVVTDESGEFIASHRAFAASFAMHREVQPVYATRDGSYFALRDEVRDGLCEVKKKRRIPRQQAAAFLAHPEQVFRSRCFVFNRSDYGERVTDIGEYKYRTERSAPSGISWLPAEGETYLAPESSAASFTLSADNIEKVEVALNEALKAGAETIEVNGSTIPVTVDLVSRIANWRKEQEGKEVISEAKEEEEAEQKLTASANPRERRILLIADNFAQVGFRSDAKEKELLGLDVAQCLRAEVELLPHQLSGIEWLIRCYAKHKGALLADDMGLGKTLQTLVFLALLKRFAPEEMRSSVLIVAPVALLNNWQAEYERFLKEGIFQQIVHLDSTTLRNYQRGDDFDFSSLAEDSIVLTSYETVRQHQLYLGKVAWSVMVLDEAQRIKNPTALTTMAAKAMNYQFGLCLTGTPVENTWVDLWSIMDFAAPGYNLGSLGEFKNNYVHPLNRCGKNVEIIKCLGQQLHKALVPLFKRRLKTELVAQGSLTKLPAKIICKVERTMPSYQQSAYAAVVRSVRSSATDKSEALRIIAKLRDISLYPDMGTVDESSITADKALGIINSSARLQVAYEEILATRKQKEKALLFVESRKMQRILKVTLESLLEISIPTPLNGEMQGNIRQAIVDEFSQREGFALLILSPLAAGVGLNIAAANHVIHLSRHWNPAKEDQATDRAYRIGQTKDVRVCIPLAVHPSFGQGGSFDEKLDSLLTYKRNLSAEALFPVADSEEDGLSIFSSIAHQAQQEAQVERSYYTLESIDQVAGAAFERIIAALYAAMGYHTELTSQVQNMGADIVAFGGKDNLLIKCKKARSSASKQNERGLTEICAARTYYEKAHQCKFKLLVVTNAEGFTMQAEARAKFSKVELVTREKLGALLTKYPVERIFL